MTTSQVSRTAAALRCSPSRAVLPKPARNSSPVPLRVGLDPDDQAGVAEADPVAGARAVDGGVLVRVVIACGPVIRPSGSGSQVAAGGRAAQGLLLRAGRVQRAVDQPGEPDRDPGAADRDAGRPRRLAARVEAHRGAGRDASRMP